MAVADEAHDGETTVARPASTITDLVRALGQLDSTMIVVGILIGSGIFIVSAESARLVGAIGWLLVVWALAGLMTVTGAQCGAELAAMLPRAGGQYVFLREAYGPGPAFLFGWALFLIIQTGKIAAVAVAFATFSGVVIPWISVDHYLFAPLVFGRYAISVTTQQFVAVLVILLLTAVNTWGLAVAKRIQNTLTVVKTTALIAMIVLGLTVGWNRDSALWSSSWWDPTANGWTPQQARPGLDMTGPAALVLLLGLSMVGPLFSQTGWANVTFTGGEVRSPGRNLPRALAGGTAIVVTLYLLANLSYAATLPLAAIQHAPQNRVGTAMMQSILGTGGALVMAVAIMISTFSTNNGLILAGARVHYAMARDGLLFNRAGTVNARHVPAVALLVQGVWASLLTLPQPEGPYDAVSMVAVLHHVPFRAALIKAAALLPPRGVLLVLGLDRSPSLIHFVTTRAVATLISGWYRAIHRSAPVGAPIAKPQMTLREIRDECAWLLPGVVIRRHALLRYSLVWTKP